MCDKNCQKTHIEYQKYLLNQIRVLANEVKGWRMISSSSQRMSLEDFMRSTDLCGWQTSLERGPLGFPSAIKGWFARMFRKG